MAEQGVSVSIDTRKLVRAMKRAPQHLEWELADAFQHFKSKYFKTLPSVSKLKPRSRSFWKTIQGYVNRKDQSLDRLSMRLVSYWKGAQIQEEGGVKAGSGRMMTIPMGRALTAAGRVRKSYQKASAVRGLFSKKSGSKMYLYKRFGRGKNATIEPVFRLKRSVQLKPKLGFERAFQELEGFQQARVNTAVDRALRKLERE